MVSLWLIQLHCSTFSPDLRLSQNKTSMYKLVTELRCREQHVQPVSGLYVKGGVCVSLSLSLFLSLSLSLSLSITT
jgi:hypothetical protein